MISRLDTGAIMITTVRTRHITGLPRPRQSLLNTRGRMSRDSKQVYLKESCQAVAAKLKVYAGQDVFVDLSGAGILIDTHNCRMQLAPKEERVAVTEHLVQQWRELGNDAFVLINTPEGELLAVSVAEFVGLGVPEADPSRSPPPLLLTLGSLVNIWLMRPLT